MVRKTLVLNKNDFPCDAVDFCADRFRRLFFSEISCFVYCRATDQQVQSDLSSCENRNKNTFQSGGSILSQPT